MNPRKQLFILHHIRLFTLTLSTKANLRNLLLVQVEIRVLVVLTGCLEDGRLALDRERAQYILLVTEQTANLHQRSRRSIKSGGHVSRLPKVARAVHHGELSDGEKYIS